MTRTLVILLALAHAAHAGVCLSEEEADADMKLVEAAARNKAKLEAARDMYAFLCVELDAKRLRTRVGKACQKILDRDGEGAECMRAAAVAGFATLGTHDVFAWISKHVTEDPIDASGGVGWGKIEMLAAMDPARALPIVLDMWHTSLPRADAREKRHREMMSWSGWRQRAAAVLGAIGTQDEIAFLDEQAKATKDKHVAKACRDAIRAVEKRVNAP